MTSHPYPGLRPFNRDESALFFGREEQVDQLLDKLEGSHFLAVVGVSGSGKSSLVRAGLLPALDSGFMSGTGARWTVAEMRPGDRPVRRLAAALLRDTVWGDLLTGAGEDEGLQIPPGEDEAITWLEQELMRGSLALNWRLGIHPLPGGTRLLILADQFEELFRYQRTADNQAAAFASLLLGAASHPDVYVVVTMRSEFLGDCARYPQLAEAINNGLFLTPALDPEQSADAIQLPARLFGGEVSADLVRHLLAEAEGQQDRLPLLQHALTRLWDMDGDDRNLTLERLTALGGLRQALEAHVEEAFFELSPEQRAIAEVLFRALAERGPAERDTRRPVLLGEVADLAEVDAAQVAGVVEVFRAPGRSFLVPPAAIPLDRHSLLDITHEALIRQWKRLRAWTQDEAERAEMYQRLRAAAGRWVRGQGALWINPDLEYALQWRDRSRPTQRWAERYGGEIESVMEFLDASLEQREAERRALGARRARKLRRARITALAATLGLVIVAGAAGWGWLERQRALALEHKRTLDLFDSALTHAALLARTEDYARTQQVLDSTYALDTEVPFVRRTARDLLRRYAEILGTGPRQVYPGPGAPLSQAVISPDGALLAGCGERGVLVLFDTETGELTHRLEGHDPGTQLRDCVFHPAGNWLASAGDDGYILRWSLPGDDREPEILGRWRAPGAVMALAVSPDGQMLASAGDDHVITIWDAGAAAPRRILEGHRAQISEVTGLAFSPNSELLASASYDGTARLWNLSTGLEIHRLEEHGAPVKGVAFDGSGRLLATGGDDLRVILWDVATGAAKQVFTGHRNMIYGLAFAERHDETGASPLLIAGGFDRTLRIWDLDSAATLRVLQGHTAAVNGIAVQGDRLYSAASDGTIRRWDLSLPYQRLLDVSLEPASAAISPDGKLLAMGSADGGLNLFALPDLSPLDRVGNAHAEDLQRLAFSDDGSLLASAGFEGIARIWRIRSAGGVEPLQVLTGHTDAVHDVAFSPDGGKLATAGYDGRIGLFDITSGTGRFTGAGRGQVLSVAFDPSGELVYAANRDTGSVQEWNFTQQTPTLVREIPASRDFLMWAELNAAGSEIAAVGRDYEVSVLDTGEGRAVHHLPRHENAVFKARFLPGDGLLATASVDATVRFWDLSADNELFALRLPTNKGQPVPLWDFDLQCTPAGCWLAVPLTRGKLAVYDFGFLQGDPRP